MKSDSTGSSAVNDDAREQAFYHVSAMMGVPITGFHRVGEGSDATFYFDFGQKRCLIGPVHDLFDLHCVRCRIYSGVSAVLRMVSEGEWNEILRLLTKFRTEGPLLSPLPGTSQ